jgi:hypothetical protein
MISWTITEDTNCWWILYKVLVKTFDAKENTEALLAMQEMGLQIKSV